MHESFGIVLFVVVGIGVLASLITLFGRSRLYDEIGRGMFALRDDEIRQLLEARNDRRRRRGEAELDVEAEIARLTAPALDVDPALLQEIRQLVLARNARRLRRGEPPLDVEAEVARQVAELGGG